MKRSLIIVGPSGSGKTALATSLSSVFKEVQRPSLLINLDPYNINLSDAFDIDIQDLIQLEDVMTDCKLGYIRR